VTARLLLLAAALPLAGLAQLELTLVDTTTTPITEKPIDLTQPLNVGAAAACQTISQRIRIRNEGGTTVEIDTLEVAPIGAFTKDSGDPLPGSSFLVGAASFRDIWIDFAPHALGTFNTTLTVSGEDAVTSQPVNTIALAMTGTGVASPTVTDGSGKSYCPGDQIHVGNTQVGTTAQTTITIANPTTDAVVATVAGADFGPGAPVGIAVGASQTFQLTFTPSIPNTETGTLTVTGFVYNLTGTGFTPPPPILLQPALQLSANASVSSNQALVTIPLAAAASLPAAGQLTLTFTPANKLADDPNIGFVATSTRVMSVEVSAGDTAVHFQAGDPNQCTFQTGTTEGTIGFALSIGGVTATAFATIAPAPVALDLSTAVPATDEIILSLAGFDNTHKASALAFTFYDTTGKAIAPGLIQADVTGAFANYYKANPQAGGTFNLQATFPVTGDITQVAGVEVQFTNPAGVTTTARLPVL
jgi:hypothetical protein